MKPTPGGTSFPCWPAVTAWSPSTFRGSAAPRGGRTAGGRSTLARCAQTGDSAPPRRRPAGSRRCSRGARWGPWLPSALPSATPSLVSALVLIDGGLPQVRGTARMMLPMILPFSRGADLHRLPCRPPRCLRVPRAVLCEPCRAARGGPCFPGDTGDRPGGKRSHSGAPTFRSCGAWYCGAARAQGYFRRNLSAWRKPLLLAWGSEDGIIPRATAEMIAALVPRSRTVVIPGAGHLPQQERPGELAAEMEALLSSL